MCIFFKASINVAVFCAEIEDTQSSGGKGWIPTADHTELASPIWHGDQRRRNDSFHISNVDKAVRRLQQHLEQLEIFRAHESNDRAINFERMAEESKIRAEESDRMAGELQRVLTEVRESLQGRTGELQLAREQLRELEQCVQERKSEVQLPREHASGYVECLSASYSSCAVRRAGSELELGRGDWATVSESEVRINTKGEESDRRAEESDRRAEESDRRAEESDRRAEESDRRAEESDRRAEESDRRAEESDRMAEESDRRAEESDRRAEESDRRAEESDRRTEESDRRAEESDRRTEEEVGRAEEAVRRAEESDRMVGQLQQELAGVRYNLQEHMRKAQIAGQQQVQCEQHLQERVRELQLARQQLRECEQHLAASSSRWVVRREEIEMTGPELGRGGWATVGVATFRGVQVAAKTIHRQIISPHNIQLFRREMNMAARLRHPNLVQFIGATSEGNMVILTELMPTSLRAQIQLDNYLQPRIVTSISLDIARALNYLHQMQPDPIIHRDIGSANVLLEPLLGGQWRAKLSDYGTVNLVRQLETVNPGSPVYAAPEANNPCLQSPKMDIYSFGALMLEMLTGRLPTPEDRPTLLLQVHHDQLLDLIQRCLRERKQDRPNASTIIRELNP